MGWMQRSDKTGMAKGLGDGLADDVSRSLCELGMLALVGLCSHLLGVEHVQSDGPRQAHLVGCKVRCSLS